jgi:hypothetical protein
MDATQYYQRCRELLDDPTESARKKGYFWEDSEIIAALNYSQNTIVAYLARKNALYLLQRLVKTVQGVTAVPIPEDYFYPLAAQVALSGTYFPAQIYQGGISRNFWYSRNLSAFILKDYAYFRSQNGYESGKLVYIKKPSVMTISSGDAAFYEAASFDRVLYDVFVAHACACLLVRQEPTTRLTKNLQSALTFLLLDNISQIEGEA